MQRVTDQRCPDLLGSAPRYRSARVSIDGTPPMYLVCLFCGGDLLIPTGADDRLARAAQDAWMVVEFTHEVPGICAKWAIRACGYGRKLTRRDHRGLLPYTTGTLTMSDEFASGVRLRVDSLSGMPITGTPSIPAPRG